jgi:arylsulfatase A-like enzyme
VRLKMLIPLLLVLAGAAATTVAFAVELLGTGAQDGFGVKQTYMAGAGIVMLLLGLFLVSPVGQRRILKNHALSPVHDNPVGIMAIAVWYGLVTGILEVAIVATQKLVEGKHLGRGYEFVWMVPLADILLFAVVGVALYGLGRRFPMLGTTRVVTLTFSFLGFIALLQLIPWLDGYAALILAAGLASLVSRFASSYHRAFNAIVRYTIAWTGLLKKARASQVSPSPAAGFLPSRRHFLLSTGAMIGTVALGLQAKRTVGEYVSLASLPSARPSAPNVLLIVLDTVRAQSLSLYGYERPTTPFLERFARTGVTFDRAISTAPWTLPSHASMFTGKFPHELFDSTFDPLPTTHPTLAEILSKNGYATAGFAANTVFCSREFGLARGFGYYEDYRVSPTELAIAPTLLRTLSQNQIARERVFGDDLPDRKSASSISDDFLNWVSRNKHQPYFAFLNYYDAHEPYLPPPPFATLFSNSKDRPRGAYGTYDLDSLTKDQILELHDAYDNSIAYVDDRLSKLFAELERQGSLGNTIVVITSDHGELFGEHGMLGHFNGVYRPTIHVPLIISAPSLAPVNVRVGNGVSLRDIPATILDLVGTNADLPGQSLSRLWSTGRTSGASAEEMSFSEIDQASGQPTWYPAMKGPVKSLLSGWVHYIKSYGNDREEVYDLRNDPSEEKNLADSVGSSQLLEPFRATMKAMGEERST